MTRSADLPGVDETVEGELGPGEIHRYRFTTEAGRFLRVVVDQEGVDLAVGFEGPSGELVEGVDRLNGDHGPELLLAVTGESGGHAVVLRGDAPRGTYRLRVTDLRTATAADRRAAEAFLRFAGASSLTGEAATARWTELAASWRELDEPGLEAEALRRLASAAYRRLEGERAADLYRAAVTALQRAGERRLEGMTRIDLGETLVNLGDLPAAAEELSGGLAIARAEGDAATEAAALQSLGTVYLRQGELQRPLDLFEQALVLFRPTDSEDELAYRALTLHELGVLYGRYLGDGEQGRQRLEEALATWPRSKARQRATTLAQLGQIAFERGDYGLARRRFAESRAALGEDYPCLGAVTQARQALVDDAEDAPATARDEIAAAVVEADRNRCRGSAATIELLAASLAERQRDWPEAKRRFQLSYGRFVAQGDGNGEAAAMAGIARAERALGDLEAALEASRRALSRLTGVRPTLLREDLRTSFFATVQDQFDFHIRLLLDRGEEAEAWATAEQARAQALRDSLLETRAGPSSGEGDPLFDREAELQRSLNALDGKRSRAVLADAPEEQVAAFKAQIAEVVANLEAVRGELRRRGAGNVDQIPPSAIVAANLQRELDAHDLLLEYRLGATASHLWAVDRHSVRAFALPPRSRVEEMASEASALLHSRQWRGSYPPPVCAAARTLLGPVADLLGRRRLLIVADGGLESLAFAALPQVTDGDGCPASAPLIEAHQLVSLPSAAVLASQRRVLAGRPPAPRWLAVLSDPIYEPADPRRPAGTPTAAAETRAAGDSLPLSRLAHARAEAEALLSLVPPSESFAAADAEASKATVLGGRLAGFRILHFATHGELRADQPQLSLLALSRFDAAGRAVEGNLYAHEVYGLDLPAELVVLSACDTGLGRQVRGEGLVSGLPRAFLHAGAKRVVVSLWAVGDDSTRELMSRFYQGMLADRLAPAEALREAQLALWRAGDPPYRWAPFVLQGEPRPLPPFPGR